MKKEEVCFIRAKGKKDYIFDGIIKSGYKVIIPYKDYNVVLRCLREMWFRLKLPFKHIWYNPEIKKLKVKYIIVKDPLIIPDVLGYIKKYNQDSKVILNYDNKVTRKLLPIDIPEYIEKWSYNKEDCKKYGMNLSSPVYLDVYKGFDKKENEYDVIYLGRDKGRAEELLAFENELNEIGFRTYFHICADRSFLRFKKPFYKSFMGYEEYLQLVSKSRSILNIMPNNLYSITQREMEAVFHSVKCITTNKGIKEYDIYDESRYYILDSNIEGIKEFLDMPFKEVNKEKLEKYKFDNLVKEMVGNNE